MRPALLVVLAGTGTEVGKTWVGRRLLAELRRRGSSVAARKPVQSFEPGDPVTDADELAEGSGEDPLAVCPPHRRYEIPLAPPMAADMLGRPSIHLVDLVYEIDASWPAGTGPMADAPAAAEPADARAGGRGASRSPGAAVDVGLVELVGGVRSPLAHDGDGVDLIEALHPDLVVVVADAGLGTINAVRTTLDSLASVEAAIVVHLNRFDPSVELHGRNRAWFTDLWRGREGAPTVTAGVTELADLVEVIGAALDHSGEVTPPPPA